MRGFRRWYGESPLQLLLLLASFALAGYAGLRLLADDWLMVAVWFVGAALMHDLVLAPLYGLVDRALSSAVRRRSQPVDGRVNFVRVPVLLSGLLLLVWFPLITGRVERYEASTGLPADGFLARWLLVSAALCGGSALWLSARVLLKGRTRRPRNRGAGG